jgi:nucleoside-diphosphate-sugar epimerase
VLNFNTYNFITFAYIKINNMATKVLVTGGAGYLGTTLVPALLAKGYDVTVYDNLMFQQNVMLECCAHPNFHFINADVRNTARLTEAIKNKDIIIPLAALVGAPLCAKDENSTIAINRDAVITLNKLRSKNQIILFPTTNSGYGIGQENLHCTEETPLQPISLYGTTKSDAEADLLNSENVITYRLATVYGCSPRMRLDLLVNDFTYRAWSQRYIVLFEAHFMRNYIHVRDVAKAFIHGIDNFDSMKNTMYNVGLSSANLSKMELCLEIKKQIPDFFITESEFNKDPDQRNYIISNAKIEATGYMPEHDIQMGITELIKGFSIMTPNKYSNV